MLNYGYAAKNGELQLALFHKDTNLDSVTGNTGYDKRKRFSNSKEMEMFAPIHCQLFNTGRYMLRECKIELELHRNSNKFVLLSDKEDDVYKIKVIDLMWYVWNIELQESANLAIDTRLLKDTAKYPIRRVLVINTELNSKGSVASVNNLFNGDIPRFLGLVPGKNFTGSIDTNPFNFKHYDVNTI